MVRVLEVTRGGEGVASEVVVSAGGVSISYILMNGRLFEKGRWTEKQILDIDGLTIPPSDYRRAVKMAAAVLGEKRKRARQR